MWLTLVTGVMIFFNIMHTFKEKTQVIVSDIFSSLFGFLEPNFSSGISVCSVLIPVVEEFH